MPVHFKYNVDNKLLYGTIEGQIGIDELRDALGKITTSTEFPPNVNALWDLRNLDFSRLNADFGEAIISAREENSKRGNSKIALIAEDDLDYGMSRMYQMLSDNLPQKISVFRDTDIAENWLLSKT